MKIKLDTSDPHTRAILENAKRNAEIVATWPAWKRGLPPCVDERCEREHNHPGKHRRARESFDEWEST